MLQHEQAWRANIYKLVEDPDLRNIGRPIKYYHLQNYSAFKHRPYRPSQGEAPKKPVVSMPPSIRMGIGYLTTLRSGGRRRLLARPSKLRPSAHVAAKHLEKVTLLIPKTFRSNLVEQILGDD